LKQNYKIILFISALVLAIVLAVLGNITNAFPISFESQKEGIIETQISLLFILSVLCFPFAIFFAISFLYRQYIELRDKEFYPR